jgi:S-(hydroxymethyl)glutathione dehydrogenase/alcohol dehydrogenase
MPLPVSHTQAAILVEQRQPLVVDQIALPETLEAGQVLVEVQYSGICGSQLGEIAGVKGEDRWLPHLLGHEGGAIVLAIGPGVRHVKVDDRVVMHWRKGRGIDAIPAKYRWQNAHLNAGCITTFQKHAIVSENRLTPISSDISLDNAALFGCPVTTGLGVVENNAKLRFGQSIVVWGAGGVGLNVIQGAALVNAMPIVAIDLFDNRLGLAGKLGATHLINAKRQDPAAEVKALLGGSADVVVDNTGRPDVIRQCYDLTATNGRTILVGVPHHQADTTLHTLPLHFEKRLLGSHGGECQPADDIPRYLRLVQAGKLDLAPLVTHRYRLNDINQALNELRDGTVTGRCLIEM